MPENDELDYDLAAIAEFGYRTGRLDSAATVRARADRRRRRRFAGAGALGVAVAAVLGVGIAAAVPPDDGTTVTAQPGASPSVSGSAPAATSAQPSAAPTTPSSSAAAATKKPSAKPTSSRPRRSEDVADALSGERQLFIFTLFKGEEVPDSVVAVTKEQQVEITLDYGERALFVPKRVEPDGDEFLMQTGKIRVGGEPDCWSVEADGGGPADIVTAACDFGDRKQRITITEAGYDNQGRMTYTLRNGDRHLTYDPVGEDGFAAQNLGGEPSLSTYVFIDRGESTIPELG
jgi:hypothetical protein